LIAGVEEAKKQDKKYKKIAEQKKIYKDKIHKDKKELDAAKIRAKDNAHLRQDKERKRLLEAMTVPALKDFAEAMEIKKPGTGCPPDGLKDDIINQLYGFTGHLASSHASGKKKKTKEKTTKKKRKASPGDSPLAKKVKHSGPK